MIPGNGRIDDIKCLIFFISLLRFELIKPKLKVGKPVPGYKAILNKDFRISMGLVCSANNPSVILLRL